MKSSEVEVDKRVTCCVGVQSTDGIISSLNNIPYKCKASDFSYLLENYPTATLHALVVLYL